MESTVIGVYDNYDQAQNAVNELVKVGFGRRDIQLSPMDQSAESRQTALMPAERETGRVSEGQERAHKEWSIGNFFSSIFNTQSNTDDKAEHGDVFTHADLYSEAVRRGSYILAVQARNDEQHDEIVNIMDRYDPIDIDEREAHWRMQGWSRYDRNAPLMSDEEIQRERASYASRPVGTQSSSLSQDMGSDARTTGGTLGTGVGIGSGAAMSEPSDQQPIVSQPSTMGSTADRAAMQGHTLSSSGMDYARRGGIRIYPYGSQSEPIGSENITDNQSLSDDDFRSHWQTNYGQSGGRYEDHAPAYQYGSTLASDTRYNNYHQWNDLEPQARTDWEASHAGHPWEKAKDAVRYSWEKMTGKDRQ